MSVFFVRTAAAKDLPAIRDLLGETWHNTYDSTYGAARVAEITAAWHSVEALKSRLTRPNSEFLVADDGSSLGGMAFAAAAPGKTLVVLHQLYVRPRCQGQGIGTDLLRQVETAFPEQDRLRVEVDEADLSAVAFYRAKGFVSVGRSQNDGPDETGFPTLVFEKRLG